MRQSKIREALLQIPQRKGRLLAADVVRTARNPESPLHAAFDWDDSTAAEKYRLWQARQLITSVMVAYDDQGETIAPVFVSLGSDRKAGGYRPVSDVLGSPELREEMLRTALAELNAFQLRYNRFKELAVVFKAAKRVQKRISKKQAA